MLLETTLPCGGEKKMLNMIHALIFTIGFWFSSGFESEEDVRKPEWTANMTTNENCKGKILRITSPKEIT